MPNDFSCRVLIVDDEYPARKLIESYLGQFPGVSIAGSFSDATQAISFLQQERIDIIFTDIQMPQLSGLDFVRQLSYRPLVIFTTAYSQYAVEGFELNVIDYLLKPISFPRFLKSLQKAFAALKLSTLSSNIANSFPATIPDPGIPASSIPATTIPASTTPAPTIPVPAIPASATISSGPAADPQYIHVRAQRTIHRIALAHILYIEGYHEYIRYHLLPLIPADGPERLITAYQNLKDLQENLPSNFIRIHKSYIINSDHIQSVSKNSLSIQNTKLPIGDNYRALLKQKWPGETF